MKQNPFFYLLILFPLLLLTPYGASGQIPGDATQDGMLGLDDAIYILQAMTGKRDFDRDGFTAEEGDCNDANSMINPNAPDFCGDGIDQDCNGIDLVCLPQEFYGGWQLGDNTAADFISVTIFSDGVYMQAQNSGMEFGTLSVDPTTDILTVLTVIDQNGEHGFSNLDPDTTMTVSGNTLTITDPDKGPAVLTRVLNASDLLKGAWHFGSDQHKVGFINSLTFYDNGTYILIEYDAANEGASDLEFGAYTYANGEITLTVDPEHDQNLELGTTDVSGIPLPVIISNNVMILTVPDEGDVVFFRVK